MKKLFIPGPTHVREEILQAQTRPMIGHRSSEYAELQLTVTKKLQELLFTDQRIYIFASASTGVMEGSIRQASQNAILSTVCGAFSKRWYEIIQANGITCEKLEVPLGEAITVDLVEEAITNSEYDAITLTMNETSTGIMNPVKDIAEMIRKKSPNTLILVDAVSCMAGVEILFDEWGLDVCFAGTQKCFALPPGLVVCAVSNRARERALDIPNRGYYFSYSAMDKNYDKGQTPATPAISLIYALDKQMDDILAEGIQNRFDRHLEMAKITRDWASDYFDLYGNRSYLSNTVTNIANTRGINVTELNKELGKRGAVISNGYGDLKEKCFRIGHMGDHTPADISWLLNQIEDVLGL